MDALRAHWERWGITEMDALETLVVNIELCGDKNNQQEEENQGPYGCGKPIKPEAKQSYGLESL